MKGNRKKEMMPEQTRPAQFDSTLRRAEGKECRAASRVPGIEGSGKALPPRVFWEKITGVKSNSPF
jgi:hypothetical protein